MQIIPHLFPGLSDKYKDTLVMPCSRQVTRVSVAVNQVSKSLPPTPAPEMCFDTTTGKGRILDMTNKYQNLKINQCVPNTIDENR